MRGRWLIRGGSAAVALATLAMVVLVWAQPTPFLRADFTSELRTGDAVYSLAGLTTRELKISLPPPAVATKPAVRSTPPLAIGSYQQVLINRDRAAAGLRPLTWSTCLQAVAISNAHRMAAQGYISHTNGAWLDLECHLGSQGGENVGWWSAGIADATLNGMFMASPDHRANIMGPYRFVATAWAVAANGYAYIAVEFT